MIGIILLNLIQEQTTTIIHNYISNIIFQTEVGRYFKKLIIFKYIALENFQEYASHSAKRGSAN